MKIKELEELTGIPRANIRFYEKEGMLSPGRAENGYREYSEDDKNVLLKIKLLRSLDVSLDDIKALKNGEDELSTVLENHLKTLENKKIEINRSIRVCQEICEDKVEFKNLDALKYINSFDQPTVAARKEDVIPMVKSPIRRFLARELDFFVYTAVINFIFSLCNINVFAGNRLISLFTTVCATLVMLLLEPLLLMLFGTTLGKWIFGLYVYDENGRKLTYDVAFARTGSVLWNGMAFVVIPIYSWYRMWKCYQRCSDETDLDPLEWEYESELQLRKEPVFKPYVGAICALALSIGIMICGGIVGQMPKHRGSITVAQFAENFNRFNKYIDGSPLYNLDKNGDRMSDVNYHGTNVVIDLNGNEYPIFSYVEDSNGLREVRMTYSTTTHWPKDLRQIMLIAANSFACTEKSYSYNSQNRNALFEIIEKNPHNSFNYSADGITVECVVKYSGYSEYAKSEGFLFSEEGIEPNYDLVFTMRKE